MSHEITLLCFLTQILFSLCICLGMFVSMIGVDRNYISYSFHSSKLISLTKQWFLIIICHNWESEELQKRFTYYLNDPN